MLFLCSICCYYTSYIFMTESRVLIGPFTITSQVLILLTAKRIRKYSRKWWMRMTSNSSPGTVLPVMRITIVRRHPRVLSTCRALYDRGTFYNSWNINTWTIMDWARSIMYPSLFLLMNHRFSQFLCSSRSVFVQKIKKVHEQNYQECILFQSSFPLAPIRNGNWICMKYSKTNITWFLSCD